MRGAENIYWLFSAAAQTVAAFVAFLLAGYALVQTMMDSAAADDETLLDIHESLKQRYHRQLAVLVVLTALAIVSSLAVVYLNALDSIVIVGLAWAAAGLTMAAVLGGVAFVVSIIDPKKYRKAAERLERQTRSVSDRDRQAAPSAAFFTEFVRLERSVREAYERVGAQRVPGQRGAAGFRDMVEALRLSEVLNADLYERLLSLNRHRNLLFHGRVQDVSEQMLEDLRRAQEEFGGIAENILREANGRERLPYAPA